MTLVVSLLLTEKNTTSGRQKSKHVFQLISRLSWPRRFLAADSESTQKVASIGNFLAWMSIFCEIYAPNPDFGWNPVFAVHLQQKQFRTELTPGSDSPWSKVPPLFGILFFFYIRNTLCAPLPSKKDKREEQKQSSPAGFEPAPAEPALFQVRRLKPLGHSDFWLENAVIVYTRCSQRGV